MEGTLQLAMLIPCTTADLPLFCDHYAYVLISDSKLKTYSCQSTNAQAEEIKVNVECALPKAGFDHTSAISTMPPTSLLSQLWLDAGICETGDGYFSPYGIYPPS
jgi:hypothetical protein